MQSPPRKKACAPSAQVTSHPVDITASAERPALAPCDSNAVAAAASLRARCAAAALARFNATDSGHAAVQAESSAKKAAALAAADSRLQQKHAPPPQPAAEQHSTAATTAAAIAVPATRTSGTLASAVPAPRALPTGQVQHLTGKDLHLQPLLRPVPAGALSAPVASAQTDLLRAFAPEQCAEAPSGGIVAQIARVVDAQPVSSLQAFTCGRLTSFSQKNVRCSLILHWASLHTAVPCRSSAQCSCTDQLSERHAC